MDTSKPPDVGDIIERAWPVNWGSTAEDVKRMLEANPSTLPIGAKPVRRVARPLFIEQILARFWQANCEEGWGFTIEDVGRLMDSAPSLPADAGKLDITSLRIRLGNGDDGVRRTFEAHVRRVKVVFGKRFHHSHHLDSDKESLRLLVGNHTHKPTVEWIMVDLDANWHCRDATTVRGPNSLADELLVIAWMFPELIWTFFRDRWMGLFAAGYEATPPAGADPWLVYGRPETGSWLCAPNFNFGRVDNLIGLDNYELTSDLSGHTMPELLE